MGEGQKSKKNEFEKNYLFSLGS